jgi:hypothetical protein
MVKKASNGPIRQRQAMAMGGKPTVSGGGGNTYKVGNAGQGSIPGASKRPATTMPSQLQLNKPKGAK